MKKIVEYLDELGIIDAYNTELLIQSLEKFYTSKKAASYYGKFYNEMSLRADGVESSNIYTIINDDLDCSLVFTGGINYSIYKDQGEWIEGHKSLFGKSILEIGCMNGLMTCFLASLFPDSNIVGIDICKSGIVNARKLAKRLNLNNVKFEYVNFQNYKGEFDTIYTSLFLHETFDLRIYEDLSTFSEKEQIEYWANKLNPSLLKMSSLLKEAGNAICFERFYFNIAQAGLFKAFSDNKLILNEEEFNVKAYIQEDGLATYLLRKDSNCNSDYYKQWEHTKKEYIIEDKTLSDHR
ncbi:MAG: class I SAM-dependent methyltransferase [Erysipelotrichaceae bacterium]|nr:class I SAM-dependent methyltransferase [Erysipelotrichaceae bacterium]